MNQQFADLLNARYIQELEGHSIAKVMDLFDTKKDSFASMDKLEKAEMKNVSMNYQMLAEYNQELL